MRSTSSLLVQICRKTTSKTCWKSCKTTIKLGKNSVRSNHKFLAIKTTYNRLNEIYSMTETYPKLLEKCV
jgi:hypothetical protein